MLKTRSYAMVRSPGNLIQWRKSLFDTVLVYNNKNKPMLHYKFGSVYGSLLSSSSKVFPKIIESMGRQTHKSELHCNLKLSILNKKECNL